MNQPTQEQASPRFICDGMVKGLAKWLRFLGFSADILTDTSRIAEFLQREPTTVFITRSKKHVSHLPEKSVLILQSDDVAGQLHELNRAFAIFARMNPLSRCGVCNVPLQPIDKEKIKQQVPPRVWDHFDEFWRCPHCGRIYWKGGHVLRLTDKLRRLGVPV